MIDEQLSMIDEKPLKTRLYLMKLDIKKDWQQVKKKEKQEGVPSV